MTFKSKHYHRITKEKQISEYLATKLGGAKPRRCEAGFLRNEIADFIVTIQLTRKFKVYNPDFMRKIELCPQNLLNSNIL